MNGFYVSMVFLGIIFIAASLVCIMFDKRSSSGLLKKMDEKNREIVAIINDAEQMTEELNKFSDYVLTRIDEKNEELQKSLKMAEEHILRLDTYNSVLKDEPCAKDVVKAQPVAISEMFEDTAIVVEDAMFNSEIRNSQKLLGKHERVIKLYRDGLNESEIAKMLNMGKGEIQLILELNK